LKFSILILSIFIVLLLISCAEQPYAGRYDEVTYGMTPVEVRDIMGPPFWADSFFDTLYFEYHWYEKKITISFRNNSVVDIDIVEE